jgi:alkanesulfonate monooxygenase SsuD/methylene tetrahydromethanopterin reductase-like flavin-dependent oxidoreductase (luciferase family)
VTGPFSLTTPVGGPRLGVLIPNATRGPSHLNFAAFGRSAEHAGADFLWVSDHVVFPADSVSPYPVGAAPFWWHPDAHWIDCLTVCAVLLTATSRVVVGSSVLLLPIRHPLHVAKAAVSLAYVAPERFVLGLGIGWQSEELESFGVDFPQRGPHMDEALALVSSALAGEVGPYCGGHHQLPHKVFLRPSAAETGGVPVLLGGMSGPAVRRIGTSADGWLSVARPDGFDFEEFSRLMRLLDDAWLASDRPGRPFVSVRLLTDSLTPHESLVESLCALGVDEIAFVPQFEHLPSTSESIACAADLLARHRP